MEVRTLPDNHAYRRMTTAELRGAFVLDALFVPDQISMVYCDTDRAIVGGALPGKLPLPLEATRKELAAGYFNERRELGIVNVGGRGSVAVDGHQYAMEPRDMLYVGRGARSVEFAGGTAGGQGAAFYFVSFPAHASYPHTHVAYADAAKARLGGAASANQRTINKYIHEDGARSAQLVMGLTELDPGSVWNTMPPHTHQRRMEIYLYIGLAPDAITLHLMGEPAETRSLILRNRQAVISPSWSIHCAAATTNYSFIWAMGGENQEFADMDAVGMRDIL